MFDWFGKKKPAPPPAQPANAPSPKPAAGPGTIVAFEPADAIGTITLESGEQLRFGRSACVNGLQPAVGVRVQVREIEPHPRGGWRAKTIELAAGEAQKAAALLDAQDRALGAAPASNQDAAGIGLQLGALTVLLADAPQPGRLGLQALFDTAQLAKLGVVIEHGPNPTLRRGTTSVHIDLGTEPFPSAPLDLRFDREARHLGRGFLVFRGGLPGMGTNLRVSTGGAPDAWSKDGPARLVTQIALQLIDTGLATGVVVHRAGQVLQPAAKFRAHTASVAQPEFRALGAWVDLGLEDGLLASYGMDAFWLPDVAAPEKHAFLHETEGYARAHEAVLAACHLMVRENRMLKVGDELAVPLGLEVGGFPLEADNPGLTLDGAPRWRVRAFDAHLELEPVAPIPALAQVWAQGALPYPGYRAMLVDKFESHGWTRVARMGFPASSDGVPPHEVFVYDRRDGTFATFTCGFGRVAQPGGTIESDSAHIELMLGLPGHRPQIASALEHIGAIFHSRVATAPPIGPEHRIALGMKLPPADIEFLVMAWSGRVELGAGPSISLFAPMIMTAEEKARVPSNAIGEWIASEGVKAAVINRWLPHA